MKKLLISSILAILPFIASAQHYFKYLAETPSTIFYLDTYLYKGKAKIDTIWEKRIFTDTTEGQEERNKVAAMFKNVNAKEAKFYYVKNVFDLKQRRTKVLSMYLFGKNHEELGTLIFKNNNHWQKVFPNTITEMQLQKVLQYANKPIKKN